MLTVWTVCVGDKYTEHDVRVMRHMVEQNLSMSHRFMCLADRPLSGIDCLVPAEVWPGWWSKLLLFKYAQGRNLYLDLDNVVTGPLDDLVSTQLSMPKNWAQSGHGGCQSSVMSWGIPYPCLHESFDPGALEQPRDGNCGAYEGLWGDQEYITRMLGDPGAGHVEPMRGVYSYKYHCRQRLPEGAKVVCFHGKPKPSEVTDQWVVSRRSM